MFKATINNTKVMTELDDKTNRLTAKISFDCVTNPDSLLELDELRLKGKTLEVNIFTTQSEFGKKPDVPGSPVKEDPLWDAGDKPGAAQTLLATKTPADAAKEMLAGNPPKAEEKGKKKNKEPEKPKPTGKAERVDYPPEPPLP
jgi:hypothetical protein